MQLRQRLLEAFQGRRVKVRHIHETGQKGGGGEIKEGEERRMKSAGDGNYHKRVFVRATGVRKHLP